jgi:hypothetical protein
MVRHFERPERKIMEDSQSPGDLQGKSSTLDSLDVSSYRVRQPDAEIIELMERADEQSGPVERSSVHACAAYAAGVADGIAWVTGQRAEKPEV